MSDGRTGFLSEGNIVAAASSLGSAKEAQHERPEYVLTKKECLRIKSRFEQNEIHEEEIREWANIIEFNDSILYEDAEDKIIADMIHAVATPETDGRSVTEILREFSVRISR